MRALGLHALALALVLAGAVWLTSPGVPFTSDEGAVMIQARIIEHTHHWIELNPFPNVDAAQQARTVPAADVGTKGRAPYAKHPLYPWLVAVVDQPFGYAGVAALGILGTVVAAAFAALITDFLDPRWRLWAFWLTGLGTPLVFDTGIVVAHTLGAAAVGGAGYATLKVLRGDIKWLAVVMLGIAGAAAFRTEGLIFGAAVVVTGAAVAVGLRGMKRTAGIALAAAAGIAVLATREIEHRVVNATIGPPAANHTAPASVPANGLFPRIGAMARSWLWPAPVGAAGAVELTLGIALVALLLAGFALRTRRPDLARSLLVIGIGMTLIRIFVGPALEIPGLLLAFPAAAVAIVAAGRTDVMQPERLILAVTFGVFALGVFATQYTDAGGLGWGGRYFAIGLPLLTPLVCAVVAKYADGSHAKLDNLVPALGVASLLIAGLGWWTIDNAHRGVRNFEPALTAAAKKLPPSTLPPVVLTTYRELPQLDWPQYFQYRWLVPPTPSVNQYERGLAADGVHAALLVTNDPGTDLTTTAPYRVVDEAHHGNLTIAVLETPIS